MCMLWTLILLVATGQLILMGIVTSASSQDDFAHGVGYTEYLQVGGRTYVVFMRASSFSDAIHLCQDFGGALPMFDDVGEFLELSEFKWKPSNPQFDAGNFTYWIEVYRHSYGTLSNAFYWNNDVLDDDIFEDGDSTDIRCADPSNVGSCCAFTTVASSGKFSQKLLPNTVDCDSVKRQFICKIPVLVLSWTNECASITLNQCQQSCLDLTVGFECGCATGWRLAGDLVSCSDEDECGQENTGVCGSHGMCNNTIGSYTCSCVAGYQSIGSGVDSCEDVDECSGDHTNDCVSPAWCANTEGSYDCSCPVGYAATSPNTCEDVDECEGGGQICLSSQTCVNTQGTYACQQKCSSGYEFNTNTLTCQDVNECHVFSKPCNGQADCVNGNGDFTCRCSNSDSSDSSDSSDNSDKDCPNLINWCGVVLCSHGCAEVNRAAVCQCPQGYSLGEDTVTCYDVDECLVDPGPCPAYSTCYNSAGSFRCECDVGFYEEGSPASCQDVDECAYSNTCADDDFPQCVNTVGSYVCQCASGFARVNDSCSDIDECDLVPQSCEQLCVNEIGSYRCGCESGYTLDESTGTTCTDVDECEGFANPCDHACQNTVGSYSCSCHDGYSLDSMDGRSCSSASPASTESDSNSGHSCVCSCSKHYTSVAVFDKSVAALATKRSQEIREELIVDTETLSSTIRKKESAKDERSSAQVTGMVLGIGLISAFLGLIVMSDALRLFDAFGHCCLHGTNGREKLQ